MRAVLIDPFACAVTEIAIDRDHANSTLFAIYTALSLETMPVHYIEAIGLPGRGEALFVDEEGAIKDSRGHLPAKRWFRLKGYHAALAGKGLILGSDSEGNERSTRYRAADIAPLVTFLDAELVPFHLFETRTPWTT